MQRQTVLLLSSDHVGWTELRAILESMPDVRIIGEATDLRKATDLFTATDPDVIVAEAAIEGTATVPFLVSLQRGKPTTSKLIVVAARYEQARLLNPFKNGVVGYLLWGDLSSSVLRHCLAALIGGDVFLVSRPIALDFLAALQEPRLGAPTLSTNELAVLQLLTDGLTNRAIGVRVGLSERSVERLVTGLERKLGAANKFVLAVRATRLGLIH